MVTALGYVKETLGILPEYTVFDNELWMHVEAVLSELNQVWTKIGREHYSPTMDLDSWLPREEGRDQALMLVSRKVRLRFDPPQNAFLVKAIEQDIEQIQWRLTVAATRYNKWGDDKWVK